MAYSLRRRLTASTIASSMMAGLISTVIVLAVAWHEVNDAYDDTLKEGARLVLALGEGVLADGSNTRVRPRAERSTVLHLDYQIIGKDGAVLARGEDAPRRPFVDPVNRDKRYYDVQVGKKSWRVYVRRHKTLDFSVQIGQQWEDRNELIEDALESLAWPLVALCLVMGLLNGWLIRRLTAPLAEVAARIETKSGDDLSPLPQASGAREIRAMTDALNRLLERLTRALERERRFTADAAHELRTPLTSLRLHVGNLRGAGGKETRLNNTSQAEVNTASRMAFDATLAQIEADTDRAATVLRDLLALARASRLQLGQASQTLDLAELARRVVAEYGQAALDARHGLVLHVAQAAPMHGHPVLLEIALRNLLDNALAHTPAGTCITVAVSAAPLWLQVCDNARPSQQPQQKKDHAQAQNPHRQSVYSAGLGLGHQVVRRIAEAHGGSFDVIHVSDNPPLRGWRLTFGLTSADANRTT